MACRITFEAFPTFVSRYREKASCLLFRCITRLVRCGVLNDVVQLWLATTTETLTGRNFRFTTALFRDTVLSKQRSLPTTVPSIIRVCVSIHSRLAEWRGIKYAFPFVFDKVSPLCWRNFSNGRRDAMSKMQRINNVLVATCYRSIIT